MSHALMPGDQVTTGVSIGRVVARGVVDRTRFVKVQDLVTGQIRTYTGDQIAALRRVR